MEMEQDFKNYFKFLLLLLRDLSKPVSQVLL